MLLADDFEAEFEPRSKKVKTKEVRNKDEIKQEKIERKSPVQSQRYTCLYMYIFFAPDIILPQMLFWPPRILSAVLNCSTL